MAWTAPMTAVSNTVFTAAQWNTYVRDNMLQSLPALAATAGNHYVSTAANAMAERTITSATVATPETTVSTTYAALATAGPAVTVTTGTAALVFFSCKMANNTLDATCQVSVAVSGSTTIAASDSWMLSQDGLPATRSGRAGMVHLFSPNNGIASNGLTANSSHTFTLQYKVSIGTGTFQRRDIAVIAL